MLANLKLYCKKDSSLWRQRMHGSFQLANVGRDLEGGGVLKQVLSQRLVQFFPKISLNTLREFSEKVMKAFRSHCSSLGICLS